MAEVISDCSWFERMLESDQELSHEDEALFLAHADSCARHRDALQGLEQRLQSILGETSDVFETTRMFGRRELFALVEPGMARGLEVRIHHNDVPLAEIERDGRTIAHIFEGQVIFDETATLDDRIAMARLIDEFEREA